MTTAHRPTWKAAVGRANEGGWTAGGALSSQTSNLDAPAHTKLKFRQDDDRKAALAKSLMALEEAERKVGSKIGKREFDPRVEKEAETRLLKQTTEVDQAKLKEKGYDDSDIDDGGNDDSSSESDLDASDSDGNSDSDDDDDDEAALQAELAKIRAEREESKRQAQEQEDQEEMAKQEEAALLGNPLLASGGTSTAVGGGGSKRRRWNEDVVFRNQAKGEPKLKKRFINDTVRNDFHKRFLNKFIR